ncbi:PaaI family thioesterase [Paracoccus marinaquae]|uniref:PaaI family thioesterase n=1 Tax=Paracoccus marinaquae TaxID=2841926 RepID=A0ABS6AK75_9RHOB|nr:PaaI family thioesterase [Paracoccus marinaquae]MBU3030963.1 PaaI family thioesterase [Paracoccus marinaquae]
MQIVMDAEALNVFLAREFPQVAGSYRVERVDPQSVTARLTVDEANLRPGGTVSGPSMFALADLVVYCAILSRIGPVALAVTTNASIDFMRKPEAGRDLIAECRLLKLGRVLAVAEAMIFSEGGAEPVARCSMTYSIPPKR